MSKFVSLLYDIFHNLSIWISHFGAAVASFFLGVAVVALVAPEDEASEKDHVHDDEENEKNNHGQDGFCGR